MNRTTRYFKSKKGLIPKYGTICEVFDQNGQITKEYIAESSRQLDLHMAKYSQFSKK